MARRPALPFSGSTPLSKTSWRTPSGGSPSRTLATDLPTATGSLALEHLGRDLLELGELRILDGDLSGELERPTVAQAPQQGSRRSTGLDREVHELRGAAAGRKRKRLARQLELALPPSAGAVDAHAELRGEDETGLRRGRLRERSVLRPERLRGADELELADDLVAALDRDDERRFGP